MLIDSHAHLHFEQYRGQVDEAIDRAARAGVKKIISVGVDEADSQAAVDLAGGRENVFASVGLHPHEAKRGQKALEEVRRLSAEKPVIAIGECGLDYYRNLSPKDDQEKALRFQIELALEKDLPVIFHVRDAFDDFRRIIADYPEAKGIIHSFSADSKTAEWLVERGFLIGLNGIMTFTKDEDQLHAAKIIPLENLALETDCPFLSPAPKRGGVNEPANLEIIARFLAGIRSESFDALAHQTTGNVTRLLKL